MSTTPAASKSTWSTLGARISSFTSLRSTSETAHVPTAAVATDAETAMLKAANGNSNGHLPSAKDVTVSSPAPALFSPSYPLITSVLGLSTRLSPSSPTKSSLVSSTSPNVGSTASPSPQPPPPRKQQHTAYTTTNVLSYPSLPDVFDCILENTPSETLLTLRATSSALKTRPDSSILCHIVLSQSNTDLEIYSAFTQKRVPLLWTHDDAAGPSTRVQDDSSKRYATVFAAMDATRVLDVLGSVQEVYLDPIGKHTPHLAVLRLLGENTLFPRATALSAPVCVLHDLPKLSLDNVAAFLQAHLPTTKRLVVHVGQDEYVPSLARAEAAAAGTASEETSMVIVLFVWWASRRGQPGAPREMVLFVPSSRCEGDDWKRRRTAVVIGDDGGEPETMTMEGYRTRVGNGAFMFEADW